MPKKVKQKIKYKMDSKISFDPADEFNEVSEILESLELSGGWRIISIIENNTIKERKDIDNEVILASETIIRKSPDEISEAILDPQQRQVWDPSFISSSQLQNWGKNLQLIHLIQRYKWPLSDRDFILIQGIAKNHDERITIGWKSVKYDKKPPIRQFVRGRIVYAGFVITKIDDVNSHVSYYEKSFPNVSLPLFIEKKMQIKAVELPFMLKSYFK